MGAIEHCSLPSGLSADPQWRMTIFTGKKELCRVSEVSEGVLHRTRRTDRYRDGDSAGADLQGQSRPRKPHVREKRRVEPTVVTVASAAANFRDPHGDAANNSWLLGLRRKWTTAFFQLVPGATATTCHTIGHSTISEPTVAAVRIGPVCSCASCACNADRSSARVSAARGRSHRSAFVWALFITICAPAVQ